MSRRASFKPSAAFGARVDKTDDTWSLVLVREFRHRPAHVWEALTDPEQLRAWAPFDASGSLAHEGAVVSLTTLGAPTPIVAETTITRAVREQLLEYRWGGHAMRWELEPHATGTRLTLWHQIDRGFIAWGAAGWHLCFDVLAHHLDGDPLGRIVGGDAMAFDWQRLNTEYAALMGVDTKPFPGGAK